ncbi:hypothetical protein SAMN05444000_10878 [Shimia gijangensis]|uniref:Uncharacterized protein n=1 Tax=Shimia gijangensis TaxID=1470563 RepID=A0A1M6J1L8_9RHOB|nr:hypothetical protein SAMN05444000_10878 [Shimia gijangensis]
MRYGRIIDVLWGKWRARKRSRGVISFLRTCMYRWAPDNQARARTEPAPSELLKATGMQPDHEKGRTRQGST